MAEGEIASANVVGYVSKNDVAADGWYMISLQFEGIGKTATLSLDDAIKMTGVKAVSYDDAESQGAQLQVPNGSGYDKYFYVSDAYDKNDNPVDYDCWCDNDGYILTDANLLALGNCAWLKVPAAAKTGDVVINVSGEVYGENALAVNVVGNLGWNMIGNPFPTALDPKKINMGTYAAVGYDDAESIGCQMQIPSGNGYDKYFYVNDAYDKNDNPVDYDCWCDNDGYILEEGATIAAPSQGFWIKLKGEDGQLIFGL